MLPAPKKPGRQQDKDRSAIDQHVVTFFSAVIDLRKPASRMLMSLSWMNFTCRAKRASSDRPPRQR
jgi:hypothetical protein